MTRDLTLKGRVGCRPLRAFNRSLDRAVVPTTAFFPSWNHHNMISLHSICFLLTFPPKFLCYSSLGDAQPCPSSSSWRVLKNEPKAETPRNPKNDFGIVLPRSFFHSPELTTLGAEMVPKRFSLTLVFMYRFWCFLKQP